MDTTVLRENTYFHEPALHLKVIKRDPELPYRLHSHEFHELVVVESGRGTNYTPDGEYPIAEGSVFYVPPGAQHGYKKLENLILYNIIWGADLVVDHRHDLAKVPGYSAIFERGALVLMHLSPSQLTELIPVIQMMEKEADDIAGRSGSRILAYSYLLEVLVSLARIWDQTPTDANKTVRQLWEVISHMDRHLDSPLTTEELTEIAVMSSSTLHRTFKQTTGLAPIEYHLHKRIARACSLIQQRGLSMAEVGEACGFSDPNYFSRQFRKVMGMSPKQYQRIFSSRFT